MVLSLDFWIGKRGNKNILVRRLCLQNETLPPPLPLKPNRSLPQENWRISELIPTLWKVSDQNKDSQSKWYYKKGREQETPWLSYEAQLVWRAVDASFHCRPSLLLCCPGDYHLLFPFVHQGKWRQSLKVNTKYNAIATELLFHKVLYLEVREGSDQTREG